MYLFDCTRSSIVACRIFLVSAFLSCSIWEPVFPRPGIKPVLPMLRAGSLSHWITREAPK